MTTVAWVWLAFFACALIIVVAGPTLSRNGDIIADRGGFSANWIGLVLLGTITSIPELATGITAVSIVNVPNIAVGDVLGSVVFNLLILAVVDAVFRQHRLYEQANVGHILAAGWGVVLVGFAGFSLTVATQGSYPSLGHIGLYTPITIGLYLLAVRSVFFYERRHREPFVEGASERYPDVTLNQAVTRFAVASVIVIGGGVALPFVGSALAEAMGWQRTFVGSLFVAGATSLPELVITISAVRLGALNLAIANLLGSNLFDMFILAVDDLFYFRGPLLSDVSAAHAASAASGTIMSGLVIVSLLYRPTHRVLRAVGWTSLGLFLVYLVNSYVLFLYGS